MVKKIRWSPKAADNFEEICAFIGKNSEFYASMFARKIIAIVTNIPSFPDSGRIVPEYQDSNLREKIFQNYRIVYRKKGQFIEIVTISHAAKQLSI
jgi:plasmid stabilization system protein ParE